MLPQILEIAEALMHLDPIRTYSERGAEQVARLVDARGYRLRLAEEVSEVRSGAAGAPLELPLRHGRQALGTLELLFAPSRALAPAELRLARWGARMFARGIAYTRRLAAESAKRGDGDLRDALARTSLTPREREVVRLLAEGTSTRLIAETTGLTVATVNTYLKRIFAKLGVHSRVELVARVAGTSK